MESFLTGKLNAYSYEGVDYVTYIILPVPVYTFAGISCLDAFKNSPHRIASHREAQILPTYGPLFINRG